MVLSLQHKSCFLVLNRLLIEKNINHLWLRFVFNSCDFDEILTNYYWAKWGPFTDETSDLYIEDLIKEVKHEFENTDIDTKKTLKDFNLAKYFFITKHFQTSF